MTQRKSDTSFCPNNIHSRDFLDTYHKVNLESMKVLFDTKKVQKLGRIVLSDTLLRNADLHEGDAVDIYFDVVSKNIVIQKADAPSLITERPETEGQKRNRK